MTTPLTVKETEDLLRDGGAGWINGDIPLMYTSVCMWDKSNGDRVKQPSGASVFHMNPSWGCQGQSQKEN